MIMLPFGMMEVVPLILRSVLTSLKGAIAMVSVMVWPFSIVQENVEAQPL